MRLKSIEASRRENGMSCLDTQKVQVLSQMHIHFHSMNSVRPLSTQHHVKNCYFLRIEHFRTLTCNKCIVCCAKHNELFKLARHPNPRRHWENFLYSSPIQIQTHNQMEFGALLYYFFFAFICVLLSRVRQEWLRDEYLFVCLSLFVFVYSIRMLLILQTAFSYWNKEKKTQKFRKIFAYYEKFTDKTTEGKTKRKEKKQL